ncbi:MAG TPA: hypothetical protein VNL17_11540 [Verrucomicrobiae bacterium]|nr:hypothetical protein [Verrucomicrobiae bacterium]
MKTAPSAEELNTGITSAQIPEECPQPVFERPKPEVVDGEQMLLAIANSDRDVFFHDGQTTPEFARALSEFWDDPHGDCYPNEAAPCCQQENLETNHGRQ